MNGSIPLRCKADISSATNTGHFISLQQTEELEEAPSEVEEEEEIEKPHSNQRVHHLLLWPNGEGEFSLLAGTALGLYVQSRDVICWASILPFGSGELEIYSTAFDPQRDQILWIGTDEGVYYWNTQTQQWESTSLGMRGQRIHELEFSRSGHQLWAATDQGVYYLGMDSFEGFAEPKWNLPNFLTTQEVLSRYRHEPKIEQVQEWAILYAEVHPDKIQQWRKQAKMKAYMPEISFSLDHDRDTTVDIDRGGTNDPDRFIIGPREESFDVDVSFSWDLADLIWSTDQTSIDVRSRLMVQLREHILDEVTRLYFERRRLQMERDLSKTEDIRQQLTQELRLEELTAQIDALTGGEFSRYIQR